MCRESAKCLGVNEMLVKSCDAKGARASKSTIKQNKAGMGLFLEEHIQKRVFIGCSSCLLSYTSF